MKKQRIHNLPYLRPYRKKLRKNMTPAEEFLWAQLKNKQFEGRKFRRQHSIGRYIVDFYCAAEKLVIELDGQVHMNTIAHEKDVLRTMFLERKGFSVVRFENKMVIDFLPSVLSEIKDHFSSPSSFH